MLDPSFSRKPFPFRKIAISKSHRASSDALSPLTSAGLARYAGILSADELINVVVVGNLPKGETAQKVSYSLVDRATRQVLSQFVLPDRSNVLHAVHMLKRVRRASGAFDVGTFAANGDFQPTDFLSVRLADAA
jgi:hypothetical protein